MPRHCATVATPRSLPTSTSYDYDLVRSSPGRGAYEYVSKISKGPPTLQTPVVVHLIHNNRSSSFALAAIHSFPLAPANVPETTGNRIGIVSHSGSSSSVAPNKLLTSYLTSPSPLLELI